jgi:hypothetical protein
MIEKFEQRYSYVGPQEIIDELDLALGGYLISTAQDVQKWIKETSQEIVNDQVTATFIIKMEEQLMINDRRSEHVICAGGKEVLSAGEITFAMDGKEIYVSDISNQSTGYCPNPESWKSVKKALEHIGIEHPDYFTGVFEFRYCVNCKNLNLIKDQVFECAICGHELPSEWNFDKAKSLK